MLKYLVIDVSISEHHTQRVTVPAWELPILTAIHARQEPEVIEEVLIERPVPDAGDEFRRLANRYKNVVQDDGSQGAPWVAAVYGQFQGGDSRFAKAIRDAEVQPEAAPAAPVGGIGDLLGEGQPVSSVGG